ncbi:MAG: type II secretion system protein GspD, partial [Candidatus Omnitrophica bacterium]|nr:type II secretion system protein GspD [Candidatus Omnitrophota bacterium]
VSEDFRTNSIIVSDVPSQFTHIEQAIEELDVKLPQVMIEVEIIETTLDTVDKLGVEWGSATEGDLFSTYGAMRTTRFPFNQPGIRSGTVGSDGNPTDIYLGYVSAANLGATLSMLATNTDTRILARPRILTLNNQPAEINITSQTAVASLDKIVGGAEGIGTQTSEAERVETGVALKVTPQVNRAGEITMLLEPSVTNTKWSQYFANTYVDPQTRSAKTTVSVRDGQTVVIGGLISIEDSKSLRKTPFLGDIPFLGNLFRKQDDSSTDKELIIFITPHLIIEQAQAEGLMPEKKTVREYGRSWEYEGLGRKDEAVETLLDQLED